MTSFFSCPHCKNRIDKNYICSKCDESSLSLYEGIPILVKNYESIEEHIEEAKAQGKQDWYESSQEIIWKGPYRHHLLKRKKYVESVLGKYNSIKKTDS